MKPASQGVNHSLKVSILPPNVYILRFKTFLPKIESFLRSFEFFLPTLNPSNSLKMFYFQLFLKSDLRISSTDTMGGNCQNCNLGMSLKKLKLQQHSLHLIEIITTPLLPLMQNKLCSLCQIPKGHI